MPAQLPPTYSRKPANAFLPIILMLRAAGIICLSCTISCTGKDSPLPNVNPDLSHVDGLSTHSLEQRKRDLTNLLADAEHEQILNKKLVESRMGRPDTIDQTGSKQFEDKIISTSYRYHLAAGEYILPDSQ